jgi:hypothetical protein
MGSEESGYSDYTTSARVAAIAAFLMGTSLVLAALSVRRIGRALSPAEIG